MLFSYVFHVHTFTHHCLYHKGPSCSHCSHKLVDIQIVFLLQSLQHSINGDEGTSSTNTSATCVHQIRAIWQDSQIFQVYMYHALLTRHKTYETQLDARLLGILHIFYSTIGNSVQSEKYSKGLLKCVWLGSCPFGKLFDQEVVGLGSWYCDCTSSDACMVGLERMPNIEVSDYRALYQV